MTANISNKTVTTTIAANKDTKTSITTISIMTRAVPKMAMLLNPPVALMTLRKIRKPSAISQCVLTWFVRPTWTTTDVAMRGRATEMA
jgi:hypothetical protein